MRFLVSRIKEVLWDRIGRFRIWVSLCGASPDLAKELGGIKTIMWEIRELLKWGVLPEGPCDLVVT